jgi:hypothetical protein
VALLWPAGALTTLTHVDHLTEANQATRTRYRRYIANDIAPSKIGLLPLTALTNANVAQWLNSLTGSAKTAANKHGFLAGALNAAVRAKEISANPCDGNVQPKVHGGSDHPGNLVAALPVV